VLDKLDDNALTAYHRDGFLAIPSLIDEPETVRLRTILMDLHNRKAGFNEGAQFDAAGLDDGTEQRFPQILNPSMLAPELRRSPYFDVGMSIAKQILGETARPRVDVAFFKPPRIGSPTPWHQDIAFANPRYDWSQFSIWLALTPASAANSCLSFIPGSHKLPVLNHRPIGGDPRIHALECIGDFDKSQVVECPLLPGGCTIHDLRTLHYAGPNLSDQIRLAYVLIFDTKPVLRGIPHDFPWREQRNLTARASREQHWRWRRGLFTYAWRKLHNLRLGGLDDLKRIKDSAVASIRGK
jgi:Phytanoyl-CoA dioxygenase (PhyH)